MIGMSDWRLRRNRPDGRACWACWRALAVVIGLAVVAGSCARPPRPPLSEMEQLQVAVRELLSVEQSRPGYHDMRVRILAMGPEVDPILMALAQARTITPLVRSNALVMLAERRAPGALQALERSLSAETPQRVRAAAVVGAQRLAPHVPEAARLVRLGVTDPARTVRLTALIALDVSEVETMRSALNRDRDPNVRQVARQLIRIA
jgi:HEAT repeat protein